MTKKELSIYAGVRFYNLSTRPGAKRGTIYCLTIYEVTKKGTCKYEGEVLSCVANKRQVEEMQRVTKGIYHSGRPSAAVLTEEFLKRAAGQLPTHPAAPNK